MVSGLPDRGPGLDKSSISVSFRRLRTQHPLSCGRDAWIFWVVPVEQSPSGIAGGIGRDLIVAAVGGVQV